MNGQASKATDRDIRRAFGERAVGLVDTHGEVIEDVILPALNSLHTIAEHHDRRLGIIEARSWPARWHRMKTEIWPNLWHGFTHPFENL